jgi:molybdate transport system ATP-binding protein
MTARLSVSLHDLGVRRGGKWVLRDIDLELKAGQRCALVGDNGSGKTQLLKLIAGDVWPTPTGREQRIYRVGRREVDLIEAKSRIAYLGAELQDKYARYGWDLPVRDLLATGLHRTDLLLATITPAERRRIDSTLRACGLKRLEARRFSSLSYGQKRLALLARALCQRADWLLLDEFYNGLDAHYRGRIDHVLESLRAGGGSWIVAAHRGGDIPQGTGRIIELDRGRVRSVRPFRRAALLRPQRESATRGGAGRGAGPSVRRGAGRLAGPSVRGGAARLADSAVRGGSRGVADSSAAAPLVKLEHADLYVDYRPVLRDLNWELREGQHWAVFGANGAGKTSFLKMLYGDLSPALGGRIERRGFPQGAPISAWKSQVGYVSPELQTEYSADVTVRDLVASGRYASIGLADPATPEDRRIAARWLEFFELSPLGDRRPRELSYGQLRRALIARALAAAPRILLLDEPLTGLDSRQRAVMKRLLARLMRTQLSLIIAVHLAEDLPDGMTHGLRLHRRRAYPTDSHSAN